MRRVRDVRLTTCFDSVAPADVAREYDAAMREFGYGRAEVVHHNHWTEDPPVHASEPRLKWLAFEKADARIPVPAPFVAGLFGVTIDRP